MPAVPLAPTVAARACLGAIAATVGLGFDWGVHRALTQVPFAPFALADRIVRLTPGPIATYMIDHLHHAARQLLAGACAGALIAAGALLWVLPPRSRVAAAGGFGVLMLIVGLLDPVQGPAWGPALGAVVAGSSYAISLSETRRLAHSRGSQPSTGADFGRREALVRLSGVVLVGGVLNVVAPLLATEPDARLLGPAGTRRPPRAAWPPIPGLAPEVTSVPDHYVVEIDIASPVIDAGSWRLAVNGMVKRPLKLSFDELQRRLEVISEYAVLTCISNPVGGPLVGNSSWEGVRLRDVLDAAGASPGAWGLAVTCGDGYTAGIPLAAARHPGSLVAIAQDGQPLTGDHGFPCRLRIPALYGMLNPKWVTDIRVVAAPFTGYWVQRGWSRTAVVRTECRIDTPIDARAGRPTWIAGVAWAGVRGISRVEVSTDAGRTWWPARLHQPLSPWAWTQWAHPWTPPAPARYRLMARAVDGFGRRQDERMRAPHPSGASGYPARELEVT